MGKDRTVGKPITEKGKRDFKRLFPGQLWLTLPALPAPLDHGDEDKEQRADSGREQNPGTAGEWGHSLAEDKWSAQESVPAARGGSGGGHSSS